jgi:hypothetical protein
VNVEYQSPVARAQQASEKQALLEATGALVQLGTANPDVLDNIDFDQLARHTWELGGLPVDIMRSAEDVQAIREQRAAEQAAQQKAAMMMQAAELAVKAGPATEQPEAA